MLVDARVLSSLRVEGLVVVLYGVAWRGADRRWLRGKL